MLALRSAIALCAAVALSSCAAGADTRGAAATPPSAAPASSSPAAQDSATTATGSVHPVTAVVVTDDAAVAAAGPTAAGTWPAFLAADLARSGSPLELTYVAVDGAGFVPDATTAPSFTDLVVDEVSHSTQLVIFFDSRFGTAGAGRVSAGAEDAFSAVEEAAPDALIVVIGPWKSAPDTMTPSQEIQDAVREAAQGAEVAVTYVDPVAEDWPTGASEQQVADLLLPQVANLVAALARSGAFK